MQIKCNYVDNNLTCNLFISVYVDKSHDDINKLHVNIIGTKRKKTKMVEMCHHTILYGNTHFDSCNWFPRGFVIVGEITQERDKRPVLAVQGYFRRHTLDLHFNCV